MSKSVLVINTPKYCALCVLRSGILHPFCRVNRRDITDLSMVSIEAIAREDESNWAL